MRDTFYKRLKMPYRLQEKKKIVQCFQRQNLRGT